MDIKFSDLVKLYRKADFRKESAHASYYIENDEMLNLYQALTSDENTECTRIEYLNGEIAVGQTIEIEILQPHISLGWFYVSVDEFITGDFLRTFSQGNKSKKPYYIKSIDYYSEDATTPDIIAAYISIQELLKRLESMGAYLDSSNRKIIFVGKQTFELYYDISKNLDDFKLLLENCANDLDGRVKTINNFCIWLDNDDTSKHIDVKKSILAVLLSDIQIPLQALDIIDVIENVEFLYTSARGQLSIYLEDFKYEKFVQKLEENSEKFISRVNDSISKVLSQILALPIAAAAPVILKGSSFNSQAIVYIALLVYAIICIFALDTQKAVLDNLSSEVQSFEAQGKLPQSLKNRWVIEKAKIHNLIKKQTHLYWILNTVTYLAIFYSSYNIFEAISAT